ncbi:retrotransposon protein, putative, ty3-gypsy subclass [Tanacetum coccineum]
MTDMIALLNDFNYIHPNNEQNEPTQGDISETSNEPTQAKRNEFEELYASANEELLQRLYKSSHTAKEMTWHATGKCMEPEPRNVRLGLAGDGFNPFGNLCQAYSIWPVILTTYNLPQWPLIDDLKVLWALKGVETIDVATGQNYKACPTCNEDTPSVHVLGKTAYVGHRSFLKKPHKWKRLLEFNGEIENGDPPRKFDRDQIQAQLARLPTRVKGKHPSYGGVKIKRNVLVELNGTKRSIFYELDLEIDMYRSQFDSKFPNKDMKEEFPNLFRSQIRQCYVENDPGVSATSELFALAYGPTPTLISVNSCVVNGVRNNMTQILTNGEAFKDDQYILATQVKQCFYLEDIARRQPHWKVVEHVNHKKFSDGGVIMVEEDPDVIHFDNSSDLPLSTILNDLDNATLHIDGQSMEVDVPPDIIELDEDNDIINDEEALPHDLADSDDEDLVNVDDDDGVEVMSADVARGHGGDGGGDDRPPTHHIPTGCGGCFVNRGKGTRKPNLGGRKAGRLHTRQETRNLRLKKITDDKGPVPIRFEWDDKKTLMPLGEHASHWSNYLGELIREMPLYYPSWQKVPAERKAAIVTKIGTQFDLKPHMQSQRWTDINAGIQQHLQKLYNTNKASLKAAHWVINPETGTYDVESIRERRPESITPADWDAQIAFWNDPRNQARAAQNRQNRAKSTVVCRQGSRSLARLRDQMMESSATREYPSLIDTFFVTHTVNGVFTRDEDRAIYEEMLRLQALGSNTESGVPYTEEEINALARKGKQRGHLPGVGRVLPGRATDVLIPPPPPPPQCTHNSADVEKLKKKNKYLTKQVNLMMKLFRSDDKFSQMLTQYESTPEFGNASGSGGCGDDEMADDEDGGEDEEDEEDGDS